MHSYWHGSAWIERESGYKAFWHNKSSSRVTVRLAQAVRSRGARDEMNLRGFDQSEHLFTCGQAQLLAGLLRQQGAQGKACIQFDAHHGSFRGEGADDRSQAVARTAACRLSPHEDDVLSSDAHIHLERIGGQIGCEGNKFLVTCGDEHQTISVLHDTADL